MPPLDQLAVELRALHKALLQPARARYEALHGPVPGTLQMLQLLVQDPGFAWLRRLSELMADLDGMIALTEGGSAERSRRGRLEEAFQGSRPIDAGAPTEDEEGAVRGELEALLSPAGGELWTVVTAALQDHPDVATAYAAVRQLLLRLPAAPPLDEAAALHARHRWAEIRRHRSPA